MPSTRSIPSTNQPSVISRTDFTFPANTHLLVTTPSRILSWDTSGLHVLFTSSKSGIAAATESKDGSGILAVADNHTVVLHDTKRGQEKSWGLNAEEDQVRYLAYTADSKSLYMSTKVTNAVQCYSTQSQKLLSPPQTLASPPVALAVSPNGNLMISAEGQHSTVYLKGLVQNTPPTLLQPQTSGSAVSVAAFHPERPNIFALGYEDGTLAVYDASRLTRSGANGSYVDQKLVKKSQVGRIAELHRPTTAKSGSGQRAITSAAFVPGYKTRVVSVGTDGRCKLVDFAEGGALLRSWHARAPLKSVSVLRLSSEVSTVDGKRTSRSKPNVETKPPGYLIAAGSEDGKVMLYDALGLLQTRKKTNNHGEKVISVEWVNGQSPKPIASVEGTTDPTGGSAPPNASQTAGVTPNKSSRKTSAHPIKSSTPKFLGVHPALRPQGLVASSSPRASKQFAIHPDEALDSTVRHTPLTDRAPLVSAEAGAYLDLFSPVNPFIAQQQRNAPSQHQPKQVPSPRRARPRISSETFANNDLAIPGSRGIAATATPKPRVSLPHGGNATSSESRIQKASARKSVQFKASRTDAATSSLKSTRRQSKERAVATMKENGSSEAVETLDATVVANARLLRELREMNVKSADKHAGSILQGYGPKLVKGARVGGSRSIEPVQSPPENPAFQRALQPPPPLQQSRPIASRSPKQIVESNLFGQGGRWPTDSVDDSSWTDGLEEDIWITSDEEDRKSRFHRPHIFHRPPARQTSRSRMGSKGTISTRPSAGHAAAPIEHISTDAFTTAHEQVSPQRALSPASEHIRTAFPRSSSVTPRKKRRAPQGQSVHGSQGQRSALKDIDARDANVLSNRLPNSPWDRAKKARSMATLAPFPNKGDDLALAHGANPDAERTHPSLCTSCSSNTRRIETLEGEVTLMKAEVLALKAALRRNGVALPPMPQR